jgi:hypothetical protein
MAILRNLDETDLGRLADMLNRAGIEWSFTRRSDIFTVTVESHRGAVARATFSYNGDLESVEAIP